jgi:DNA-binding transcriptional LysR family regulator
MDIKDLKCFLAVAKQLNFSVAARDLYISQPTLSLRISALEEELGVKLFQRNKKKVYLSIAGAKLLPLVQDIIDKTEQISALAQHCGDELPQSGNLCIGMDNTESSYSRFNFYSSFSYIKEQYPGINIDILPVSFNSGMAALKNNEVDLCILIKRQDEKLPSIFNSHLIFLEEIVIVANVPGFETIAEVLKNTRLILHNDKRWDSLYLDYFRNHGIPVTVEYVPNSHAMQVLIRSAGHSTIMPKSILKELNLDELKVFSFDPPIYVHMMAVWLKTNINPAIKILLNMLLREDGILEK